MRGRGPLAVLAVGVGVGVGMAACANGRAEDAADGDLMADAVCREGMLRVSGADPFPELALVDEEGGRIEIAHDATELSALDGATVALCATRVPVREASDIASFRLLEVDGMTAVLGTVEGVRILRAATGTTWEVEASEAVLAPLRGRCAWIAGPVHEGVLSLRSHGTLPESVCELATPH